MEYKVFPLAVLVLVLQHSIILRWETGPSVNLKAKFFGSVFGQPCQQTTEITSIKIHDANNDRRIFEEVLLLFATC